MGAIQYLLEKPSDGVPRPPPVSAARPIYIHSKLMLVDDVCFTVGSANLSQRSMAADSEINLACDDPAKTAELRERVFRLHSGGGITGGAGQAVVKEAFKDWAESMNKNAKWRKQRRPLKGFLLPFKEVRIKERRHG